MEPSPAFQESQLSKMKRFFVANKTAVEADQDASSLETYSSEDSDAVTVTGPRGRFIDEGPLPAEEMGVVVQSMDQMGVIEPTVVYTPPEFANARRTVLIPNVTEGRKPEDVFQPLIGAGIICNMRWAPTSRIYFKNTDGKPEAYGKDTVLLMFRFAYDAAAFYDKYKDGGAIYLSSNTNIGW